MLICKHPGILVALDIRRGYRTQGNAMGVRVARRLVVNLLRPLKAAREAERGLGVGK